MTVAAKLPKIHIFFKGLSRQQNKRFLKSLVSLQTCRSLRAQQINNIEIGNAISYIGASLSLLRSKCDSPNTARSMKARQAATLYTVYQVTKQLNLKVYKQMNMNIGLTHSKKSMILSPSLSLRQYLFSFRRMYFLSKNSVLNRNPWNIRSDNILPRLSRCQTRTPLSKISLNMPYNDARSIIVMIENKKMRGLIA